MNPSPCPRAMQKKRKIACGSLWIAGLLQLCEEKEEDELQGPYQILQGRMQPAQADGNCAKPELGFLHTARALSGQRACK